MNEKWNTQNRKGYLKIHIAVNIKTKEILALEEVIDEKIHDSKMLKKLVDEVLNAVPPDEKNIVKKLKLVLLADGAHP
jgi:flagellar biosynthesis/type III secretory pathway protein FliH